MPNEDATFWQRIKAGLTPTNIVITLLGLVGTAVLSGVAQPMLSWSTEMAAAVREDWVCGGRDAQAEGDRLSGLAEQRLAEKDATAAQALFRAAITHYEKAYGCGYPDSGIRLAVLHCTGVGTPKNQLKARQYVLEIEAKHPTRAGRTKDVRSLCGM